MSVVSEGLASGVIKKEGVMSALLAATLPMTLSPGLRDVSERLRDLDELIEVSIVERWRGLHLSRPDIAISYGMLHGPLESCGIARAALDVDRP